jgi:hypothetical protein
MSILRPFLQTIKKAALGDTFLPQEFTIGLQEPQSEVSVRLLDSWRRTEVTSTDVTWRFTTACTAPLTICVGLGEAATPDKQAPDKVRLEFRERADSGRLLGEIRMRFQEILSVSGSRFALYRVRGSTNYCLPRFRRGAHYLLHAYANWRRNDPPGLRMKLFEQRATTVAFIRPHPLGLVSVGDLGSGNIFPMNIMGDLGEGYFGFALRESRLAANLVESAGRFALSGVPLSECSRPYRLAPNHKKASIAWGDLPFETRPSPTFGIPVPAFATRVREMQVEKAHRIGSHRFFIARTVSDEIRAAGTQAFVVHGFYQYFRLRGDAARLEAAVADNWANKRGY